MSHYETDHSKYSVGASHLASAFQSDGYSSEYALLATPWGIAELSRHPVPPEPMATIDVIVHSKRHIINKFPCPTRAGLVRMACREIRRIVKEKA